MDEGYRLDYPRYNCFKRELPFGAASAGLASPLILQPERTFYSEVPSNTKPNLIFLRFYKVGSETFHVWVCASFSSLAAAPARHG